MPLPPDVQSIKALISFLIMYQHLENLLTPLTNQIPDEMTASLYTLVSKHRDTIDTIREHYKTCPTHVEFIQTSMYSMRKFLLENGVEYSRKGLQSARVQIKSVTKRFSQQQKKTDRAAQAILFLVMEYIDETPFVNTISLDNAPMLAVLGVNVFLLTFATALVIVSGITKVITQNSTTGNPKLVPDDHPLDGALPTLEI